LPRRPARKLTPTRIQSGWPIFYKYWSGLYARSTGAHKVRTMYANAFRKIATPMLPILRQFYLRAGDIGRLPPGHVVGFFRPMVTELTERKLDQILELLRISPEAIAQDLRASLRGH